MGKTAMIAGATGLVGEHLLELLLRDPAYAKVITLSRRRPAVNDSKLEQILVNFCTNTPLLNCMEGGKSLTGVKKGGGGRTHGAGSVNLDCTFSGH